MLCIKKGVDQTLCEREQKYQKFQKSTDLLCSTVVTRCIQNKPTSVSDKNSIVVQKQKHKTKTKTVKLN